MRHPSTEVTRAIAPPGSNPTSPVVWPEPRQVSNQIQQTKGSSVPQSQFALPSTQPSISVVAPRTTPPIVQNVRVVTRKAVAGNKQLTVQFNHPTGNPYFSGVNVYLRRAGQQPTLVAGGAQSPVHFTVPVHAAPHAIYVTSTSNWGETAVMSSPSHPVRLI
jgi:hypothetical protein